jgi:hypothetical protein
VEKLEEKCRDDENGEERVDLAGPWMGVLNSWLINGDITHSCILDAGLSHLMD